MFSNQKKNKNLLEKEATVPTFREFISHNLSTTRDSYNSELVLLQIRMEQDIMEMQLSDENFRDLKLQIKTDPDTLANCWIDFKDIFRNYIHSEINLIDWLKRYCQQHYSETIELIKIKVENQFINIFREAFNWAAYFQSDKIYSLTISNEQDFYFMYTKQYMMKLLACGHTIQDFIFQPKVQISTIAFKTIFSIFTLKNIALTQKRELLEEIQKRITTQKAIKKLSLNSSDVIPGLIEFYEDIKNELEKIVIPKFELHDKEIDLPKFKAICKDYSRAPKLFTNTIEELLDLVDKNSELGIVFDINKDNEGLFFLFIDTVMVNGVLQKNTTEVIETRFTINGSKINNIANRKHKALKTLLKELNDNKNCSKARENLKTQLANHKYPNERLKYLKKRVEQL